MIRSEKRICEQCDDIVKESCSQSTDEIEKCISDAYMERTTPL